MPEFMVCRTYATRMRWRVNAPTAKAAKTMLDDDEATPWLAGDEEWLGPVERIADEHHNDSVLDENGEVVE